MDVTPFDQTQNGIPVSGFLHHPADANPSTGVVLSHGAGSNANAPLLVQLASGLATAGYLTLRIHLPFRINRRTGPPHPSTAAADRAGIHAAISALQQLGPTTIVAGGHSYGGRQTSMLLSETPCAAAALFLSYPLHPPDKPQQLRTAHFPTLHTPSLFVHGVNDPFGAIPELEAAIAILPHATLLPVPRSGHELKQLPTPAILDWLARTLPR